MMLRHPRVAQEVCWDLSICQLRTAPRRGSPRRAAVL